MSIQTAHTCTLPAPALSLRYMRYLPPSYEDSEELFPLVIFLHGAGERGDNLDLVTLHGWPRYAREGTEYPFILISPQLPADHHWCGQVNTLNGLLDHLLSTLRVDPKRVYVTGLSDGGTGTWLWGINNASRFAALIPVCGAGIRWACYELVKTPVWAFHGDADGAIECEESVRLVERVNLCGGNARLTVYPNVGHDCWTHAYTDPALIEWMLEQHL